jgi:hypothetical protein
MRNSERPALKRLRGHVPLTRRSVLKGVAAAGGLVAAGVPLRTHAASTVNYVGWQGYDVFLEAGDFAAKNNLVLQKTYISTAEEIITKLRSTPRTSTSRRRTSSTMISWRTNACSSRSTSTGSRISRRSCQ